MSISPFIGESPPLLPRGFVQEGQDPEIGWHRPPASFVVEQESARLWTLRLVPLDIRWLAPVLALPAGERLAVLAGGGSVTHEGEAMVGVVVLPASRLPRIQAPVEFLHLGRARREDLALLPSSLLQNPEAALPHRWESRYAVSIPDGCHGVVISEEPGLLRGCLAAFLRGLQIATLGRPTKLPHIHPEMLDPFMESLPPDVYREVRFRAGPRFWCLEIRTTDAATGQTWADPVRWVTRGEAGQWRTGWNW